MSGHTTHDVDSGDDEGLEMRSSRQSGTHSSGIRYSAFPTPPSHGQNSNLPTSGLPPPENSVFVPHSRTGLPRPDSFTIPHEEMQHLRLAHNSQPPSQSSSSQRSPNLQGSSQPGGGMGRSSSSSIPVPKPAHEAYLDALHFQQERNKAARQAAGPTQIYDAAYLEQLQANSNVPGSSGGGRSGLQRLTDRIKPKGGRR
ncbi:hypothetical protein OIO90_004713 [Microbotryomycetes sp. JL221]|nr:hypothetical protein OIO90_004713 [Microbotryomycetes sp. JL221]